ncbi:hypothetical protein Pcinc_003110 [Petrolisthes cinctipes]|uniref:Peroxidase n=1 Tax=Petrolisthes cinctipes TaxID=88211 RepID=A0AAE1L1M4_PETCI|nr:hypothetical protein Pcinc_003110 [Petrolisthes cinctipes]
MNHLVSPSLSHVSPYWSDPEGNVPNLPPAIGDLDLAPLPPSCPQDTFPCNASTPYRSMSGYCNNLKNPLLGASGHLMRPMLPPITGKKWMDGWMSGLINNGVMRMFSFVGGLLPNQRMISLVIRQAPPDPLPLLNQLYVQLGQFVDHDFAVTTTIPGVDCSPCESWQNPACAPIPIPLNDPFMSAIVDGKRRCLPFRRNIALVDKMADKKTWVHPNVNTAFLDLSPVYGNDECTVNNLRSFTNGLLKTSTNDHLLTANGVPGCRSEDGLCYVSGDRRSNENLGLTTIHLLFHREHNRLAKSLKTLNPHWDDERLFQAARCIGIAEFQHYIYNEYLPLLFGRTYAEERGLLSLHTGYFLGYDEDRDPNILTEFTGAAFRMGHSQVVGKFPLMDEFYIKYNSIYLVDTFFNTRVLETGVLDSLVRGMLNTGQKPTDLVFVEELIDKLFATQGIPNSGMDLFAINTARGRDLSLSHYTSYLQTCGILEVAGFDDLRGVMTEPNVEAMRQSYKHVFDIDLYAGGLAETPLPGGVVGPTFACIIAQQFQTAKVADRFWYEGPGVGLTPEQLQSIRSTSLSKLVCNNMDDPNPLVPPQALITVENQQG